MKLNPLYRRFMLLDIYLKLREGHQISQVAISDIVAGTKTLCKSTVDDVKVGVKKTFTDAGICFETIPGLQ